MAVKHVIFAALLFPSAAYAGSCTDPGNFVAKQRIETPFADFVPGQRATFSDGEETTTVQVQPWFVRAGSIWWTVVTDIGGEIGNKRLGEGTFDLYAENKQNEVCYGGERTLAFEYNSSGNLIDVDDAGSFTHGLDGERAGTYMPANPVVGQRWTIESIDGGALREEAQVTARTSTRVTIRITHTEDGVVGPPETKVFDSRGELSATTQGEPTSTRRSITPL